MLTGLSHWSTSYVIGGWIAIAIVGISLAFALLCAVVQVDGDRLWAGVWGGLGLAFSATVLASLAMFPPLGSQYHRYVQVSGTVHTIDSRLLSQDKGATQNFAVTYQGNEDQVWRCDDSRCSTVRPGDVLTLWCIRDFQLNSVPGWKCNFDSVRHGRR